MAALNARAAWLDVAGRRTVPVPLVLFTGALLSDWAYASSATLMWSNFSAWLLLFGLLACGLALLLGALATRDRGSRSGGLPVLVLLGAFIVQVVNFMVHMRDGWTAVVPTGLTLSVIGTALTLAAAWLGRGARA